jgi:hypothetical protein
MKRFAFWMLFWTAAVSALHAWLNVGWAEILNDRLPPDQRKLNVAYIPVT